MPSAGEALRLAFDIVKTPCSSAESARAEILLGIAREIREEGQYRATRASLMSFAGKPAVDDAPPAAPMAFAVDPSTVPADATAYMPVLSEQTQRMPIVWAVGDKADCRHCHTPIELFEPTMTGPYADDYRGALVWRHKYTGQAVCAAPVMAKEAGCDMGEDDCSCERPTHTFAEPVAR